MIRVLTIALALLLSPALFACKCAMPPFSEETVKPYEFVFYGKVVAVSGCDKTAKVKFTIIELFRGKSFETTELEFDCASDCQMSFSPGEEWLIYSNYENYGQARVELCSFSRKKIDGETGDYNAFNNGMSFADEKKWLEEKLGVQKLNEKDMIDRPHHENARPEGMNVVWTMLIGFAILGVFYFVVRKFIR
jgi:hypothetical protein